jgi:hypothetical protein
MLVNDPGAPGMTVAPFEAEPELVVDPDAPLPFAIPLQLFQPVLRRYAQKLQRRRSVEQLQLANCDT